MTSMDAAHRADYADKARIDEFVRVIDAFVADLPDRVGLPARRALESVGYHLRRDSDQIVQAWA